MKHEELRTAYANLLAERDRPGDECVSPDALLAVVEGSASESERLATLRHVGACRTCRAELDLLRTARDAATRTREPAAGRPRWAAAAAILLLAGGIAVWQATRETGPAPLRDASSASVQLVAPADEAVASLPVQLVWSAVPGAIRYEVEILGPDGGVALAVETTDTVVVVSQAGALVPGVAYRWWVEAELLTGSRASLARRLRIATP